MKLLIGIITVASVVTMHSASTLAQESVTVLLRSGESVGGELIDLATAGFTVRQNAVERQIPFDLVAAVDLIGEEIPDSQWGMTMTVATCCRSAMGPSSEGIYTMSVVEVRYASHSRATTNGATMFRARSHGFCSPHAPQCPRCQLLLEP